MCQRDGDKIKNCAYDGPPQAFNKSAVETFKKFCAYMLPKNYASEGKVEMCCDYEQIIDLNNGIEKAEPMLKRCPSCFANFAKSICEMTCSPKHREFVDVKKISVNPKTNSKGHKVDKNHFKG